MNRLIFNGFCWSIGLSTIILTTGYRLGAEEASPPIGPSFEEGPGQILEASGKTSVLAAPLFEPIHRVTHEDPVEQPQKVASRLTQPVTNTSAPFDLTPLPGEHPLMPALRMATQSLEHLDTRIADYSAILRKQERIVEGTQRRLTERLEDTNRRNEELTKLLDMQRQTLHDLSGLNRDEAEQRLLSMLETELSQETGSIILKHEKLFHWYA